MIKIIETFFYAQIIFCIFSTGKSFFQCTISMNFLFFETFTKDTAV